MKNRVKNAVSLITFQDVFILIKLIMLCIFLLFAGKICLAQDPATLTESEFSNAYRNETVIPVRDKAVKIKSLVAISNNGKTYLSWITKNQVKKGTYIIERSVDGQHFEIAGLEKGTPSRPKREVIFLYVSPGTEKYSYYRIKHIANDNTVAVSEKTKPIYVTSESLVPAERTEITKEEILPQVLPGQ